MYAPTTGNTGKLFGTLVRAVVLEELVWMHMRTVISYVSRYEDHFQRHEQKLAVQPAGDPRTQEAISTGAETSGWGVDRLFIRIYEDIVWASQMKSFL